MTSMKLLPRFASQTALAAILLSGLSGMAQTPPPSPSATPKTDEAPPFEVAKISKQAWGGRFGASNCAWIALGDGVLLIDTGGTEADARNLEAQIEETTEGKPVKWIVLTHLHAHANSGLPLFLSPGVTLYANASIADGVSERLRSAVSQGKPPKVVGVSSREVVTAGGLDVEILAPKGPACTNADLWVFFPDAGAAFVADLVTPGQCPLTIDPGCDPTGWIDTLAEIGHRKPSVLVGSVADLSRQPAVELKVTQRYLERILSVVREVKMKDLPEARVTSELAVVQRVEDYCPGRIDVDNGLAIFRRMGPDGNLQFQTRRPEGRSPARP